MENSGDIGTKFSLDVAALGPHFAAFPASGFLAPNQQAQVEITFRPTAIHPDIRVEKVSCHMASLTAVLLSDTLAAAVTTPKWPSTPHAFAMPPALFLCCVPAHQAP